MRFTMQPAMVDGRHKYGGTRTGAAHCDQMLIRSEESGERGGGEGGGVVGGTMTLYLAMCNRSTFPQAENVIDRRRRQHLIQNLMRTTDAWSGLLWWALNGGWGEEGEGETARSVCCIL